jgi:hypothetical protein
MQPWKFDKQRTQKDTVAICKGPFTNMEIVETVRGLMTWDDEVVR